MGFNNKLFFKIRVLFLFIPFLWSLHCKEKIVENEPLNNTSTGAFSLAPGKKITGSFYSSSGTDFDFIYIPVDQKSVLTATLSPVKGIDSKILIYNRRAPLPSKIINDNLSSLPEKIGPYPVSPPGVWVAIAPSTPVNMTEYKEDWLYSFSYRLHPAPQNIESEPNDSIKTANPIEGGVISGYYGNILTRGGVEKDYYSIDFPEEERHVISISLSKTSEIDAVLKLYDENGKALAIADQNGAGKSESLPFYGISQAKRIYISVNAKNNSQSEPAPYRLEISESDVDPQLEFEPNDTPQKAHALTLPETKASFSSEQDIDYYLIQNNEAYEQNFEITLTPEGMINLKAALVSQGSTLLRADDGIRGEPEALRNFRIAPYESLMVQVVLAENSPLGKEKPGYRITLSLTPADSTIESEPNNSTGRANMLEPEKSIKGHISPYNDIDFFKIAASGQKRYNIELSGIEGCQWKLDILNSQKHVTSSMLGDRPSEALNVPAILTRENMIRISCHNQEKNLYLTPYELSIKANESPSEEP